MTEATDTQQYSFKAETKQLLNILIHSLYKEREVFLRELLSNASDALNRLRFETVTNRDVLDMNAELKIHITVDKDARMLTIQDTGIGMTKDEVRSISGYWAIRRGVLFRVHGGGVGEGYIAFL